MVTGANGFVGHHAVRELAARNCAVVAVSRQAEADAAIADSIESYLPCDLAQLEQVRRLSLDDIDAVINLAGLAAVGPSFDHPDLYLRVNAAVIDTVCTVARERGLSDLRVLAVSSGAVYAAGQDMPLREDAALDPTSSPYAASKIEMERRALGHRARGVDCVVVRPFNHIGPGQGPGFLVPDLFDQIRKAGESGGPLLVGNLETRRDYTDVRDVVAAYVDLAAAETLEHRLYNVCSGRCVAGTEILTMLVEATGVSDLEVTVDPSRLRPADQPDISGDHALLTSAAAWQPSRSIETSVRDFVADMRDSRGRMSDA